MAKNAKCAKKPKKLFRKFACLYCTSGLAGVICTSNSMGSSEFGINTMSVALKRGKFDEAKPSEISIFNATRVVFIPNFTATHVIPS